MVDLEAIPEKAFKKIYPVKILGEYFYALTTQNLTIHVEKAYCLAYVAHISQLKFK